MRLELHKVNSYDTPKVKVAKWSVNRVLLSQNRNTPEGQEAFMQNSILLQFELEQQMADPSNFLALLTDTVVVSTPWSGTEAQVRDMLRYLVIGDVAGYEELMEKYLPSVHGEVASFLSKKFSFDVKKTHDDKFASLMFSCTSHEAMAVCGALWQEFGAEIVGKDIILRRTFDMPFYDGMGTVEEMEHFIAASRRSQANDRKKKK